MSMCTAKGTEIDREQGLCLAKLIDGPESMSVLLGEVTSFKCTGVGIILWDIDGVQSIHEILSGRGIGPSKSTINNNGTTLSQLAVLATLENNNINISCTIVDGTFVEISNAAVLTVLGVDAVQNVTLVEENSTQLILKSTWEKPFHSQDVAFVYYNVSLINSDTTDERNDTTNSTSIHFSGIKCGPHQLHVTAYGVSNNLLYKANTTKVNHNVTYSGGYQFFLDNNVSIECQDTGVCDAEVTVLREPSNVCFHPVTVTLLTNCSNQGYSLIMNNSRMEYTMVSLYGYENCVVNVSTMDQIEPNAFHFNTFLTGNTSSSIAQGESASSPAPSTSPISSPASSKFEVVLIVVLVILGLALITCFFVIGCLLLCFLRKKCATTKWNCAPLQSALLHGTPNDTIRPVQQCTSVMAVDSNGSMDESQHEPHVSPLSVMVSDPPEEKSSLQAMDDTVPPVPERVGKNSEIVNEPEKQPNSSDDENTSPCQNKLCLQSEEVTSQKLVCIPASSTCTSTHSSSEEKEKFEVNPQTKPSVSGKSDLWTVTLCDQGSGNTITLASGRKDETTCQPNDSVEHFPEEPDASKSVHLLTKQENHSTDVSKDTGFVSQQHSGSEDASIGLELGVLPRMSHDANCNGSQIGYDVLNSSVTEEAGNSHSYPEASFLTVPESVADGGALHSNEAF